MNGMNDILIAFMEIYQDLYRMEFPQILNLRFYRSLSEIDMRQDDLHFKNIENLC